MDIKSKKLVVFDLDGTLAPSKCEMTTSMVKSFKKLVEYLEVAVISGAKPDSFKFQILDRLDYPDYLLKRVHIFPNTASRMFENQDGKWHEVYAELLTDIEVNTIMDAFKRAFIDVNWIHPETIYGDEIENRGAQVSFSVFGQEAPLTIRLAYQGSKDDRRSDLKQALDKYLKNFEVRIAGTTTIDVTRKGIDKAFGLRQIERRLGISIFEMVFVGDALFEGGNDEPVKKTGVDVIAVKDQNETEEIINDWLIQLKK